MGFTAINNAFAPIATVASAQEASTDAASNTSAARSIASEYLGRGADQPEEAALAPGKKGSAKTKTKKRAAPASETSKSKKRRSSSLNDSLNITKPADEQDLVPQNTKSKAPSASKSAKTKKKTPSKKQVPADDLVRYEKDEVAPTVIKSVSVFAPATSMDSLDSTSAPTSFDSVKANAGKSFTLYQGATSSSSHSTNIDFSQPWLNSASADHSTDSESKYSAQLSKSDTNTVGSGETVSTQMPAKEAAKPKQKQARAKSNENEVNPPSAQAEGTDDLETSKDRATDIRRSKRLAGSAQSTSKAPLQPIPNIEDFSDVDDEDLMNFAKSVEKDIEERPSTPSKRARKDNVRDVDENEDYGGALLSQAEKKMIKEMKSKHESMVKPILRKPFLPAVLVRSPIFGASKGTLLRTCFRVGEALNTGCQAVRCGINVVIELYARVTASWREPKPSRKQHFVFKDLYHDNPPHLQGTFELWDQAPLWDLDSKAFLTATDDNGMICRMIGKMRRDGSKWKIEILSIWEASWEDVNYVAGVYVDRAPEDEDEDDDE